MTATGYVLFRLGNQIFATDLDEVREIVRLGDIEPLPGTKPPLAGVVVLRGAPLPLVDVRSDADGRDRGGDVLVLGAEGDAIGVVVDEVRSVLAPDQLAESAAPSSKLPDYVVGVGRHEGGPVLLVDIGRLLDATAQGWSEALTAVS